VAKGKDYLMYGLIGTHFVMKYCASALLNFVKNSESFQKALDSDDELSTTQTIIVYTTLGVSSVKIATEVWIACKTVKGLYDYWYDGYRDQDVVGDVSHYHD
jgi:hypothetical protein